MGHTIRYEHRHGHMTPLWVDYPRDGAPFITQSSYVFGSRALIDMCRGINEAVGATYAVLVSLDPGIGPDAHVWAVPFASDLMERLLHRARFVRSDMGTAEPEQVGRERAMREATTHDPRTP